MEPNTIQVIESDWHDFRGRTFAPATIGGGLVWTSGINALSEDGSVEGGDSIAAQAEAIYRKLGVILAHAGSRPALVLRTTDYITTTVGYRGTADVRKGFFGEHRPASTGVIVAGLFGSGVLIEIDVVAMVSAL